MAQFRDKVDAVLGLLKTAVEADEEREHEYAMRACLVAIQDLEEAAAIQRRKAEALAAYQDA